MSKKNIFLSLIVIVLLGIVAISFFGKKANAPKESVKNNNIEIPAVKKSSSEINSANQDTASEVNSVSENSTPEIDSAVGVASDEIIYYYGAECPHCKDVLKFLEENKIAEKVNFQKKEVWNDEANSNEMMEKVSECALDPKSVGVPFLYAQGKCLIGTPKVEEFFKEKAGI
jgi:glutaredoxin